jgi:hypothetical protein
MSSGVTLLFPTTGSPTHSVNLPFPAHGQQIAPSDNQFQYTAGSGDLFTVKLGRTRYQIDRVFEALDEATVGAIYAFYTAVGYAKNRVLYCYQDSVSGNDIRVPCWIIEQPKQVKRHKNNRDMQIKFEQYTHPDYADDLAATV